jgi:Ca2+/Na+ antiporter
LAWGVVTVYGVGNITKGIGSQKFIGAALMLDIFWDLCQPLILLQWAVLVLFLMRWHMLWRIERFEMGINSTQKT